VLDLIGTVGWEPPLASLNVDKPNEFVRGGSVFVVRFFIVGKHLWQQVLNREQAGSQARDGSMFPVCK
jgi:hypothetical protein